ncbi:amino acid ABC transporter membrane protein (PAAT family) [Melghirimyces profundicolus]|uniref:Amino acid ABC transporter membrane protein (PAAT family) n=1 Tax=Melghirimyces profundicolus TaxID=1242148 RepID=A0A2T6C2M8_9BACL|nr:amino acid ABC transporter permease [Melghirimyces profundicolus]PTX62570.1 amino acid ABC transporter membrane protein (PAAT family) [Melghirimyces profundicolus]
MDWSVVWEYKNLFITGVWVTFILTLVGISVGLVIGLTTGLMRLSGIGWLQIPAKVYVDIFRGTPLLLQIFFVHFAVIPTIWEDVMKLEVPDFIFSGFVALSLNAGAYIAEIFRGGIKSIDKGQMEAARSLGMSYAQAMRHIILPQAFKRMLPPLGNEFIALLKDSSLVAPIAVHDLTYAANITAKNTWERWTPYITAGVLYFMLTYLLSRVVFWLERRYSTEGEDR